MRVSAPAAITAACFSWALAGVPLTAGQVQDSDQAPADLRELLAPRQSELRIVARFYAADRATLSSNYLGGASEGRGGRGRGAAAAPPAAETLSLSPNRIARLKRFDLDWQTALGKLDQAKLSPSGRTDLDTLRSTIQNNLKQLDTDGAAIAEIGPVVPFAPKVIALYESRVRMEDVNAQQAAGTVTAIVKEIAQVRSRIESALPGKNGADGLRVSKLVAQKSAEGVDSLRSSLTNWFNHFNGYDPLFTWWMGMPYKQADASLQSYAVFLRDTVAPADLVATTPLRADIPPSAAPKFSSVPDLAMLIALPQDEMIPVVQRFSGRQGGGGRGAPAPARDAKYYEAWLAALKTLDFDSLSRNAQVDYLYIRATSERLLARSRTPAETNIPRKTDNSGIPGDARGRLGLQHDLADEMIPYSPEELILLGQKELAWCEEEMRKASREMGFGNEWKKAVEKVKDMHPPPGGQPAAIREMLFEAVDYLRKHDLITVPSVAAESLHMSMMSPERQLVNPFFTGGSQITVSYPTDTMEYDARIQSMRGNNTPFSHATAHHEMIPGHNLVGYLGSRYAGYRSPLGGTPFYGEGWALYWETILWDKGFNDTPEERVGALFWRMHRAARIIFSLKFHMGEWSPQECIDFLVDRVGHERDNATAEVRRSFQGGYSPLYQAAYLLGGLQLRGLRKELVDSRQMTEKAFHDEIVRQGSMPIAWLRVGLTKQKLARDMPLEWKFYGEIK
jgi:hypothetical protein